MFNFSFFKKTANAIKAVITAEQFDGFFTNYNNTSKDMAVVPVYSCIKIISQTIATSPLKLYKEDKKGRNAQHNHSLTSLINQPYNYMTYFNFMQFMAQSLAGRGNAYALIMRDNDYKISELIPLEYDKVTIVDFTNSNDYAYRINYNNKIITIWHEDILHFKIMSEDGKRGLNPIAVHRSTIDNSKHETNYKEIFYNQATNISGVVSYQKKITTEAKNDIKEGFEAKYGGNSNAGKTAILGDGATYTQLKLVSPMDANYIETAKLTRADIAVIFGVPLNKLGDLSQATYSNISEMNRDFYKSTLSPYYTAISQEMSLKLLSEKEKTQGLFFEFDVDILLSLSKSERYANYVLGIDGGFLTRNEVRSAENLSKIDELDEIMQKSGTLTKKQADEHFKNAKFNIKEIKKENDK